MRLMRRDAELLCEDQFKRVGVVCAGCKLAAQLDKKPEDRSVAWLLSIEKRVARLRRLENAR